MWKTNQIFPLDTGSGTLESTRPIIVHEGDHLRLRCAATGFPKPHVEWRREDSRTINVGAWQGILFGIFVNINTKQRAIRNGSM